MDVKNTLPSSPIMAKNGQDTPEYRQIYKDKMNEWRDGTREQAVLSWRNSPEYNHVDRYIRYLEGDQLNQKHARYRSKFVENKLELMRREKLALLTDSKPVVDVLSNIEAYEDTASTINRVLQAEWVRNSEADVLIDAVDIAMLHGISFMRLGAARPGRSTAIALGPDQVMPIQPSKSGLQTASAVYYRNWKPINYFKKVFPLNSQGIEDQAKYWESKQTEKYTRPPNIPEYTWSQMNPAFKKLVGGKQFADTTQVGSRLYGSIELEEYYVDDISINESNRTVIIKDPFIPTDMHNWWYAVKPGERLYPRKRLVIYAGDRLMYDGPSPYWHGLYPFEELRLNPIPWGYYGLSSYRSLMPLQDSLNEVPAGVLDMIKRALHPTVIAKTNVAAPAAWREYLSDMPGARLMVNPNVNITTDIQYNNPPQVPPYVASMYQGVLLPEFDKMAGILDIASLAQKRQMPAGDTLDQMRDSLQTPLRREERYIETFIQRCGRQKVSNVIQFYDAPQRLKLLGADGITWEDFMYDPGKLYPGKHPDSGDQIVRDMKESFWTNFACVVQPGSIHSGAEDRKKQQAMAEVARNLISIKEYHRRMGLNDNETNKIVSELAEQAQAMQQLQNQARAPRTQDQKNGPSAAMPG